VSQLMQPFPHALKVPEIQRQKRASRDHVGGRSRILNVSLVPILFIICYLV